MQDISPHRLFTDFYDYKVRSGVLNLDGNVDLARDYLARMRMDAVVFDNIVITDAQLFHSVFFSDLLLERVNGTSLWQQLPLGQIEVMLRAETLEESLLQMVQPRDGIGNHLFTYIDPLGMSAKELTKTFKARSPRSIFEVLDVIARDLSGTIYGERAKKAAEAIGLIIDRIEAPQGPRGERIFSKRTWVTLPEFADLASVALCKFFVQDQASTKWGEELIVKLQTGATTRATLVRQVLAEENSPALGQAELSDLQKVEHAYSLIYNRIAGLQHFCPYIDLSNQQTALPSRPISSPRVSSVEADLPPWFWRGLSRIQPKQFDLVLENARNFRSEMLAGDEGAAREMSQATVEKAHEFLSAGERRELEAEVSVVRSRQRFLRKAADYGGEVVKVLLARHGLTDCQEIVDTGREYLKSWIPDSSVDTIKSKAIVTVTQYIDQRVTRASRPANSSPRPS